MSEKSKVERSTGRFSLSARNATILLLAVIAGCTAGVLLWLAGNAGPQAVLSGIGACGVALKFFDSIIAE
jgi:hypothetical protein